MVKQKPSTYNVYSTVSYEVYRLAYVSVWQRHNKAWRHRPPAEPVRGGAAFHSSTAFIAAIKRQTRVLYDTSHYTKPIVFTHIAFNTKGVTGDSFTPQKMLIVNNSSCR